MKEILRMWIMFSISLPGSFIQQNV